MILLEILGHLTLWTVLILSLLVIPVGLPGTFAIVLTAFIFGWITDFINLTGGTILTLLVCAIIAEALEFFIGAATAGKYGGSKYGMAGAMIGGFLGAIWMTPVFPVLGTLLGAFGGATVFEYGYTKNWDASIKVGVGAFWGTLGGKLTKVAFGTAMLVMIGAAVY